jgi:hypothetical protein
MVASSFAGQDQGNPTEADDVPPPLNIFYLARGESFWPNSRRGFFRSMEPGQHANAYPVTFLWGEVGDFEYK